MRAAIPQSCLCAPAQNTISHKLQLRSNTSNRLYGRIPLPPRYPSTRAVRAGPDPPCSVPNELLAFLSSERDALPRPLSVAALPTPRKGTALFVTEDIGAHELLLSLPLDACLVVPSQTPATAEDVAWAVDAADALLSRLERDVALRIAWLPALPPVSFRVPAIAPPSDGTIAGTAPGGDRG